MPTASPVVEQSLAGAAVKVRKGDAAGMDGKHRKKEHQDGKVALPESIFRIQTEMPTMTLTVAHISPILSVIAGLLILIMPRLLNFVIAIFLIINGLIGLGLFRWLHLHP